MALDAFAGLVLFCVVFSVTSEESTELKVPRDNTRIRRQVLDSSLARLMQIQLQSKFKRKPPGDITSEADSSLEYLLQKRSHDTHSNYPSKATMSQPSRMSYDAKDFAYKMSGWPETQGQRDGTLRQPSYPGLVSRDNLEYWPSQEKRRWRAGCDLSRVSYRQFVQFLKTGRLCGRRGHRVRFAFAGKR